MKKLILPLFIFAFLNTNAQVALSSADKILMEKEVKLICTQDRAYFESLIKDKPKETGNYGNIPCTLKTNPFANISLTSGFTYKCFYDYGARNAMYEIEVIGKGEKFEVFYYELWAMLHKLAKEGVFEYHESNKENYWLKITDGIEMDKERGTFSFDHYKGYSPFLIYSRSFPSQASAIVTLNTSVNVSQTPTVVIMTPELTEKYNANMEAGDKAMAASDYLTAIAKFETATTINPKDANSQLMLSVAHFSYADKVFTVTNPELYKQHSDKGLYAIVRANIYNPDNPIIMYYNWRYTASKLSKAETIAFLDTIIKRTNFQFREAVYRRCRYKLSTAAYLGSKIDNEIRWDLSYDKLIKDYKSIAVSGLEDFQFILKNYAAEPLDIYQYAGLVYLREYKIDSAVYCLQKVKDNADRIKWINYDFEDLYETARINQIRLKNTTLEDMIKSDNLLRNSNFTAAIAADKFNAMVYVKRAESNEKKDLGLGLEYLKENAAMHKLIVADYETAKNIYPAILHGKVNDVITFMNNWIYKEEHFNDLNDLTKRTTTTYGNYSSPTVLYNSANTPSKNYETLLSCSYCHGTGEAYNPNGGYFTNTYYLLGGTGITYKSNTYISSYRKCDNCNGTGKISY